MNVSPLKFNSIYFFVSSSNYLRRLSGLHLFLKHFYNSFKSQGISYDICVRISFFNTLFNNFFELKIVLKLAYIQK